ncbi:MAG: tyrosine-type recombinase/integrase, partial [Bacteroidales bacterium]|nr:tyrosine-type recombinase/integrase [Bacteroidales bacterium]
CCRLRQRGGKEMNNVEPIRSKEKIYAIKQYILSDKYNQEYQARDYLLFVFGINSALRISDLLSLKIKDVINSQGEIRESFKVKTKKTKKEIKILINDSVRKALKFYLDKEKFPDPNDYIFKTRTGQNLDRIRAWVLIKKWVKAVGLDPSNYGTHTLRKSWGYHSRKNFGIPIELISEKLGHKSNLVTKRYIGISQEEINNIEKRVCL